MKAKGKTRKTKKTFMPVTFREAYAYSGKFADWLEKQAGKQAKSAYYGLQLLELVSRFDEIQQGQIEVERARRSLQKLLSYRYNPDNQTTGKTPSGGAA